jgi:hypothetical protein
MGLLCEGKPDFVPLLLFSFTFLFAFLITTLGLLPKADIMLYKVCVLYLQVSL